MSTLPAAYRFFFGPLLAFFGLVMLCQVQVEPPRTLWMRLFLDNLALGGIATSLLIGLNQVARVRLALSLIGLLCLIDLCVSSSDRSQQVVSGMIAVFSVGLALGLRKR
jgi:hypothetical protein